jgi:hypothetical protein
MAITGGVVLEYPKKPAVLSVCNKYPYARFIPINAVKRNSIEPND